MSKIKNRKQKEVRSELVKNMILNTKGGIHKNSKDKRVNKKDFLNEECNLRTCCKCSDVAVWCYMPGNGRDEDYFCDFHVSRGCSCNAIDPEDPNSEIDKTLPCCEFDFNVEGYLDD